MFYGKLFIWDLLKVNKKMNGLVKQEDLEILHNISRGQGYLFLSKYSTSIHLQQYAQLI